jgi:hypothetical protein
MYSNILKVLFLQPSVWFWRNIDSQQKSNTGGQDGGRRCLHHSPNAAAFPQVEILHFVQDDIQDDSLRETDEGDASVPALPLIHSRPYGRMVSRGGPRATQASPPIVHAAPAPTGWRVTAWWGLFSFPGLVGAACVLCPSDSRRGRHFLVLRGGTG